VLAAPARSRRASLLLHGVPSNVQALACSCLLSPRVHVECLLPRPHPHPQPQCVVFDWGGGSRACKLLAVYLVRQHHYDAEVAIDDVCSASPGVNRRVDLKQVQAMCPACAEEAV